MPARDRILARGDRRADRLITEFGDAVRELRIGLGLSRRLVAARAGISESKLARWERRVPPYPDIREAAVLMQLLGHDLVLQWYPVGGQLRDSAHARLISAFLELLPVPALVPRRLEAPMPGRRDLRAWDVFLVLGGVRVGVAAETRLRDWQALLRREEQKMRDSGATRLLLVLLASRTNRRAVTEAGPALRTALPLDGRRILPALRRGADPGANGLLFLPTAPLPAFGDGVHPRAAHSFSHWR